MSNGNTMWLVCTFHPDRTQALQLGRRVFGSYAKAPHAKDVEAFFREHSGCGATLDHFTIAYDRDKDHDVPKQTPVADAVHVTLRDPPGASNDG